MFGTRRARCFWCEKPLRAPEVVLCSACAADWHEATNDGVQTAALAEDEREGMSTYAGPRGLADDWLELKDERVRVLTQHSGMQIGRDKHGRPLVYETVVVGGSDDLWVRRYASEHEARAGHAIVLAIYGAGHTLRGVL